MHNRFGIDSSKAEILFSDYILSHLKVSGKAGFIVPEGIIFTNNTDYVELRKKLLDSGLWAVVSLPAGVFQPYSGVKTTILLIDKSLKTDHVLLLKIENDGYSLNTNRNPIDTNDLPQSLAFLRKYKQALKNDSFDVEQFQEQKHKRYLCLHKTEFKKLNAYKAANTLLDQLKKDLKAIDKIKNTDKKNAAIAEFLRYTTFEDMPTAAQLKSYFEKSLKQKAIEYGQLLDTDLAYPYQKIIDEAREYNLSFDKYAFQNEEKQGFDYEMVRVSECILNFKYPEKIPSKDFLSEGLFPIIDQSEKFISGYTNDIKYLVEVNRPIVIFGDHTRIFKYIDFKFCLGADGVKVLVPTEKFIPKYFYYILKNLSIDNLGYSRHYKILSEKEIPFPPLEVQEKIVQEIESYQKVIDGAKQVIDNYQATFEIKEEWEKVSLGEVCELRTGSTPLTSKPEYYGGDIKWLVSGDIHKEEIFDCEGRITEEGFKNSNTKILPKNSVLIALNGQGKTRGTVALLRVEATCSQSLVAFTPNIDKITCEFLFYQLKQKYQEIRNLTGDNERSGLNMPILKSFDIFLPPLSEQEAIVEKLEAERQAVAGCKLLVEHYEQKIKACIEKIFSQESTPA